MERKVRIADRGGGAGLHVVALAAQAGLLVYLQVIEWIDLYPWNDIRGGNGQELLDMVIGVAMVGFMAATWFRWRAGIALAVLFYAAWLWLQVQTFWVPYAFGASERWARIHAANFSETVQWLPREGAHLPPDASHFLLQLLLVATLVVMVVLAWRELFRKRADTAAPSTSSGTENGRP